MAIIVSLETSGDTCSVALHAKGKLLTSQIIQEPQAHASNLALLVSRVLRDSKINTHHIQAVAITSGPGSYTGLRIGTSTAKGLCYSLNVPLIAVNTLQLLVYQGVKLRKQSLLCPMLDARRMEVYCTVADAQGNILLPMQAKVIDESSFHDLLEANQIIFYGSGAPKCKQAIIHNNTHFLENVVPSVSHLGELAFHKFQRKEFEDLVHFEPVYLKEFRISKSTKPLF
jgi:tRNA threonylcarbamoyladenosine biosynthesis protein TsaB